jgi:spiro-SPASM protein
MNAIVVLYCDYPCNEAFQPLFNGKNSISLALESAQKFPDVSKIALLGNSQADFSGFQIETRDTWTKKSLLTRIAELQTGFDCIYFAFADCPFLDPELAAELVQRHISYAAEYTYADGWPFGLAPELLSPGTAGILAKILGDDDGPVERDMLFSVIQKDINSFDIEAEISEVDLRSHRLYLCADSKRNLLLLNNFISASKGIPSAVAVEKIITESPGLLRTLPAFYPIQVYGGCPQGCAICPYPKICPNTERKDYMDRGKFEILLDSIIDFSGDAVIDLSLWGELSLHPEKLELIEAVIKRPELSLIIETSGLGWKESDFSLCAELAQNALPRKNRMAPLSWIISLDSADSEKYKQLRGIGFSEANDCAKKILSLFGRNCYVQAVRTRGCEDDIEKFYRYWKEVSPFGELNIIIQKYDDFCGFLEKKQASDISPVIRQPCWHLMRDMPVLLDGKVPLCREDLKEKIILGNVFTDSLSTIFENGKHYYLEQCNKNYCEDCDEYYTYNF